MKPGDQQPIGREPAGMRLEGKLAWHPSVAAWREVAPEAPDPECIEVLPHGQKSATYRLVGAEPDGGPVIAQRSQMSKALIERTVYEQILPHLPVTSPRYYGFKAEDPEYGWLFLQDVGDERYSDTNGQHLALAGRWLALMHGTATSLPAARRLPDAGPARYLDHARVARRSIRAHLANQARMLEPLAADLDRLESDWPRVESACAGAPLTLTHGAFQPKNARVQREGERIELFPIDWETAGWGVPAADLEAVDLPTYWSAVRPFWPNLRLEDVQRLARAGQIFRWLGAIRGDAEQLADETAPDPSGPLASLQVGHARLSDAVQALDDAA